MMLLVKWKKPVLLFSQDIGGNTGDKYVRV